MKQLRSILLLLLFLHSKIGVALNVHYCGGHVAVISWAYSPENCGMEMKKNSSELPRFSAKHCCDDDLVVEQNSEDQKQPDQEDRRIVANLTQPVFQDTNSWSYTNQQLVFSVYNPPPKLKQYKLNCSFIFYG